MVKAFMKSFHSSLGGGANSVVTAGYNKDAALGAEIIGTFMLACIVFFFFFPATDPERSTRDSHIHVLVPQPFRFAVFMVHFATVPTTDTDINPTSSFGAAVIYDSEKVLGMASGSPGPGHLWEH